VSERTLAERRRLEENTMRSRRSGKEGDNPDTHVAEASPHRTSDIGDNEGLFDSEPDRKSKRSDRTMVPAGGYRCPVSRGLQLRRKRSRKTGVSGENDESRGGHADAKEEADMETAERKEAAVGTLSTLVGFGTGTRAQASGSTASTGTSHAASPTPARPPGASRSAEATHGPNHYSGEETQHASAVGDSQGPARAGPLIRKEPWSAEEEEILRKAHAELGNHWVHIAKRLPGRSDNVIKHYWKGTLAPDRPPPKPGAAVNVLQPARYHRAFIPRIEHRTPLTHALHDHLCTRCTHTHARMGSNCASQAREP
jgi:hypothetical protein